MPIVKEVSQNARSMHEATTEQHRYVENLVCLHVQAVSDSLNKMRNLETTQAGASVHDTVQQALCQVSQANGHGGR